MGFVITLDKEIKEVCVMGVMSKYTEMLLMTGGHSVCVQNSCDVGMNFA